MRLLLIRHGEIDFNRQARFCGVIDAPLNKRGRKQAAHLKKLIRYEKIDLVYASNLKRAKQTARIVFSNRKIHFTPKLREINFGKIEGMFVGDVKKNYPKLFKKWGTDPEKVRPPQGETVLETKRRVWNLVNKIVKNKTNKNKTIAIVTHGGPIKTLMSKILNLKKKGFWCFHAEPASLTTLEYLDGEFCVIQRNFYHEKSNSGFGWRS